MGNIYHDMLIVAPDDVAKVRADKAPMDFHVTHMYDWQSAYQFRPYRIYKPADARLKDLRKAVASGARGNRRWTKLGENFVSPVTTGYDDKYHMVELAYSKYGGSIPVMSINHTSFTGNLVFFSEILGRIRFNTTGKAPAVTSPTDTYILALYGLSDDADKGKDNVQEADLYYLRTIKVTLEKSTADLGAISKADAVKYLTVTEILSHNIPAPEPSKKAYS